MNIIISLINKLFFFLIVINLINLKLICKKKSQETKRFKINKF